MLIKDMLENKTKTVKAGVAGIATAASLILPLVANADTYTVKSGDTLSEIAATHGTTVEKLSQLNKIDNKHMIYENQVLELDNSKTAQPTAVEKETTSTTSAENAVNSEEASAANQTAPAVSEEVPATTDATTVAQESTSTTTEASTSAVATTKASAATSTVEPSATTTKAKAAPAATASAANVTSKTKSVAETKQTTTNGLSASDAAAKEFISQKESGGNYNAQNGQYYGRYQLTDAYLNGDHSAENQERVANAYVAKRYGSWTAAQAFWNANGWY
ncbi:LysM peptidoglycan-binding domain-containing protein [Streptococcus macacae]|uniref:LysM domain protein n=1 Tax=Streptococcus macacae NCTC 11558 TaxID=764298 RepID=G5JX39_9STRE|nr:LysM peptidoglycan-binding domain-containing protein [Streptococcus macacae]EHJ52599.1 LysM domain protein [Streptococcus macacae NCTC 11558]SUN79750.1 LysM domain protein [Streptococcus macacae NCTC 11558]